jgi:hypothetical protein
MIGFINYPNSKPADVERIEDIKHDDQQIVLSDEEVALICEIEEEAWQYAMEQFKEDPPI